MNCAELAKNIHELEEARDELESCRLHSNDTGLGRVALRRSITKGTALCDSLLEYYMDDFVEKYPDFFGWERKGNIEGFHQDVSALVPLPDGDIMAASSSGELKFFTEENGEWIVGAELDDTCNALDAIVHPDGDVIVGSGNKMVILSKEDGEWKKKEELSDYWNHCIRAVHLLKNGDIVTGGDSGEICVLSKNELGDWAIKDRTHNYTSLGGICSITTLADGRVVGADQDKVFLIMDSQGKLRKKGPLAPISDLSIDVRRLMIKGFRDVERQFKRFGLKYSPTKLDGRVESIYGMPDGGIAVVVWRTLRVLRKSKLGIWKLKTVICSNITSEITPTKDRLVVGERDGELSFFKGNSWGGLDQVDRVVPEKKYDDNYFVVSPRHQPIKKIAVLKNGDIITGSEGGEITIFSPKTDLATLKEKLEKIIKKDGAKKR